MHLPTECVRLSGSPSERIRFSMAQLFPLEFVLGSAYARAEGGKQPFSENSTFEARQWPLAPISAIPFGKFKSSHRRSDLRLDLTRKYEKSRSGLRPKSSEEVET